MRILLIEKVLALALSILQLDFKMTNFEIAQIDLTPEMARITNLPLISSRLAAQGSTCKNTSHFFIRFSFIFLWWNSDLSVKVT